MQIAIFMNTQMIQQIALQLIIWKSQKAVFALKKYESSVPPVATPAHKQRYIPIDYFQTVTYYTGIERKLWLLEAMSSLKHLSSLLLFSLLIHRVHIYRGSNASSAAHYNSASYSTQYHSNWNAQYHWRWNN